VDVGQMIWSEEQWERRKFGAFWIYCVLVNLQNSNVASSLKSDFMSVVNWSFIFVSKKKSNKESFVDLNWVISPSGQQHVRFCFFSFNRHNVLQFWFTNYFGRSFLENNKYRKKYIYLFVCVLFFGVSM
jgi:hypothetical protein